MPDIAVVGHPFSSIGMGEQARAGYAAIRAAGLDAKLYDVFRYAERSDSDLRAFALPNETLDLNRHDVRIFHVNGDEVDAVIAALAENGADFKKGRNIIVPAWELPRYPSAWKPKIEKFDEVWSISRFVKSSLEAAGIPNHHVGQAVEKTFPTFLPRKYFGIRESSFTILNFFDTKSFPARKNPEAILELYKRIRRSRPFDDIQLVLKMRSGDAEAGAYSDIFASEIPRDVRLIKTNLSSYETYSLIAACDCFASLHRAEGFGRGTAEAMWLGRLALGTGWSGNRDYMDKDNSLLVDYALVDVEDGQYPHSENQQWAEPDVDHAKFLLEAAIDDLDVLAAIQARGRISALLNCSNRVVGLRMLQRIAAAGIP